MIKWKYKPSGWCPVQAEGYFLGHYFYFRSRHSQAAIEFSGSEKNWNDDIIIRRYILWTVSDPHSAGYLSKKLCLILIYWGCIKFFFDFKKYRSIGSHWCKDCNKPLEECTCIEDTINF